MKKGIIFDLDGVLVHTDRYHYQAWKGLADELGVYFDEAINDRLRGVSRMQSLEIILERYDGELSADRKQELAERKNRAYRELLSGMTPADLSPSVKATLNELRARGYLLAIGSSSKNAKYILERVGLAGYFDAVSDGNNIVCSKPDPEVFLAAAAMLDLPPDACTVVEDAEAGLQAAKWGGFTAVGIGEAASSPLADRGIAEFSGLLEFL